MKEIKNINTLYLEDYDVYVNPYLTYSQIQQIVNAIKMCSDWSTKQTNIDMLILYHVTDITKETLEKYTHDELLQSGLIDEVCKKIKNLDQLYKAISWSEGSNCVERLIGDFLGQMNSVVDTAIKENLSKNKGKIAKK